MTARRLEALAHEDPSLHALAERLLALAEAGLPEMYLPGAETFVFTRVGTVSPEGARRMERRGTSTRYAAITALGARFLPEERQRALFGGRSTGEFTALLVERLPAVTNLGDAALIAWAAAETGHPKLADAVARVAELDVPGRPQYTVEAAWVLSALTAARTSVDVEYRLAAARDRLLAARVGDGPLFPHATGPGLVPGYRSHVACFADQTYPLQALARLHASAPDPQALAAADACAARICALQGTADSGGGTTTPARAAWWRATPCTACTSTPWPRRPSSTWPKRAAPTSAPRSAGVCAG